MGLWKRRENRIGPTSPRRPDPTPLLQARNAAEAENICVRLREAGVKCGWRREEDPQRAVTRLGFGIPGPSRIEVYVDSHDMEQARQILANHPSA